MGKSFGAEKIRDVYSQGAVGDKKNLRKLHIVKVKRDDVSDSDAELRVEAAAELLKKESGMQTDEFAVTNKVDDSDKLKETLPSLQKNSEADLVDMSTELTKRYLGSDVFEREDDIKVIQEATNKYIKQIANQAENVSEEFGKRFRALISEKIGEGSNDFSSAKKINEEIRTLWEELQKDKELLVDLNESVDSIIKEVNSEMSTAGGEIEKKYATLLVGILKGGRSRDLEPAKEKYEQIKKLHNELQIEIERAKEAKNGGRINFKQLYKEHPELEKIHKSTNDYISQINRILADSKNPELEKEYRERYVKILGNGSTNELDAVEIHENIYNLLEELQERVKNTDKYQQPAL